MSNKIHDIEGIGPKNGTLLGAQGVKTTDDLLKACGSPVGRKKMSEKIGVNEKTILEWVNRADLMRIAGVGEEYSDLLEHAGVDTVKELALRKAENLAEKMAEVNTKGKFTRTVPSVATVEKWIAHAKQLTAKIMH